MQVLTVAFDRETTDALSRALRDAGHQVLGATGRSSGRTLARVARPEVVMLPIGPAGAEAREWIGDLVAGVPIVSLAPGADPVELVGQVTSPSPAAAPTPAAWSPAPAALPSRVPTERHAPLPAARTPSSPSAGSPRVGLDAAAGMSLDLAAKLDHVRFGDYHAVLEVTPGATAYVIREKYRALSALYSPTGWPGPLAAADVPVLDEIRRGVEDAFSVLGEPELRSRYERALGGQGPRTRRDPTSPNPPR